MINQNDRGWCKVQNILLGNFEGVIPSKFYMLSITHSFKPNYFGP